VLLFKAAKVEKGSGGGFRKIALREGLIHGTYDEETNSIDLHVDAKGSSSGSGTGLPARAMLTIAEQCLELMTARERTGGPKGRFMLHPTGAVIVKIMVELLENVRGKDVFVLQSTCAPTNDNLMELLVMIDALKRSSAARVTAAIPYFGYARQDRRPRSARVAISAKVVANALASVGVARVLTMDLHADQIQGFFDIPVDNIYASPVLLADLQSKRYSDLVVVSPDVGGVVRARALAKQANCDLAIIDKRRPKANVSEVMHVIGEIEGRNCVIMDDMIDTAGTLVKAAEVLKERGAKRVFAYCTHAVFSGPAVDTAVTAEPATDDIGVWLTHTTAAASTHVADGWHADPFWRPLGMAPTHAPGQHHRTPPTPPYPSGHATAGPAPPTVRFSIRRWLPFRRAV
jgi:ribose-phosphate pyrophosphokinase